MHIALFLHFYQPPMQKRDVVVRVAEESYIPVIEGLMRHPKGKITLNINACLLSQLEKYGFGKLIGQIGKLVERGQIELVGSSAFHAFLPKLPEEQIVRQIQLQEESIREYLGNVSVKGFFPPEMAYTPKVGHIVKDLGYEWILLDSYGKRGGNAFAPLYKDEEGMTYFFRSRTASFALVAGDIQNDRDLVHILKKNSGERTYYILGLDGETFGHHRKGYEKVLDKFYSSKIFEMCTISELKGLDLETSVIKPRKSSWTILDAKRSIHQPFIRWNDPENDIHRMQWKLTDMACRVPHDAKSQKQLDRALFSCQYWWACARPWWYIELVESGAHELLQSIICSHATALYKEKALDLYHDIIATAFEWMRNGKMQRRVDQEHEYMHMDLNKIMVNQ